MKYEQITGISGMTIYTASGAKRAIGNARHRIGDWVWTDGPCVFGHERQVSRPPAAYVQKQYRFADAYSLIMHYTDEKISRVTKTKAIAPPDLSAKLLLHCYNDNTEYFVWIWTGGRCLIQKNGVSIADFISVYPAVPEISDAYIDDYGNLIWVAEANTYIGSEKTFVLAKYSNGVLIDSKSYSYSSLIAAMESDIANTVMTAYNNTSISVTNQQTTVTTSTRSVAPSVNFGILYESQYDEKQAVPNSLYKYTGFYTYIVDLWSLDVYALIAGSGNYQAAIHTLATEYDLFTGLPMDASYISGEYFNLSMSLNRRHQSSNSAIVAEWQNVDPSSTSLTTNHRYSLTDTLTRAGSGIIGGAVVAGTITRMKFIALISYSTDQIDLAQCVLTFTSGQNIGLSRTITIPPYTSNANPLELTFNSSWNFLPAVGDSFTIEVAFATLTQVETMADFTFSVSNFESHINNASPTIVTDLGNDYRLVERLASIESGYAPEFSWEIDYSSEKIYDGGSAYVFVQGTWSSKNNALIGVLPGNAIIKANGAAVTTAENSLVSGDIVTKRFA